MKGNGELELFNNGKYKLVIALKKGKKNPLKCLILSYIYIKYELAVIPIIKKEKKRINRMHMH